jgi:hypothetical protein
MSLDIIEKAVSYELQKFLSSDAAWHNALCDTLKIIFSGIFWFHKISITWSGSVLVE